MKTSLARAAVAIVLGALLAHPVWPAAPDLKRQRAAMVEEIRRAAAAEYPALQNDPHFRAAVSAISQVPREEFIPAAERSNAYRDTPLPIGYGQTISDPYIVAVMTAAVAVEPGANVLEIGTGSGYQATILSKIGARVHSIEIVEPLARSATERLRRLGISHIDVRAGDGFAGWPQYAPYDAIIVTAGAAEVPTALVAQLKIGGRLVMPLGAEWPLEQLVVVTRTSADLLTRCSLGPAMFVPLTGRGARSQSSAGVYDHSLKACYPGQRTRWP